MKQSLQLKFGQRLNMTPQLQQSLKLLQMSSLELSAEIREALDSNMVLELEEDEGVATTGPADTSEPEAGQPDAPDHTEPVEHDDIPEELPVDACWDEIYESAPHHSSPEPSAGQNGYERCEVGGQDLRRYLLSQLDLTPVSLTDKAIALALIDSIDDAGYLGAPLEEIRAMLAPALCVEMDRVQAVLRRIQALEPAGVGARDLSECLRLQLTQLPPDTPWMEAALRLVDEHLELLAAHDYKRLMRWLGLGRDELQQVIELVQSMHPRPGNQVHDGVTEYVTPDVLVKKSNGAWKVELNTDALPRLRINADYAGMVRRIDNGAQLNALKSHLQEAKWFIRSLKGRGETLLRVAASIVERQRAFLEHGAEAMKPLVLHDIAQALGLHESTISRVTTRKYMLTPKGLFELKYFFSNQVGADRAGAVSSTAIRALIKKLVEAERPEQSLSDSRLAELLSERGIKVARRTIAKYREALSIPPSNERKRRL